MPNGIKIIEVYSEIISINDNSITDLFSIFYIFPGELKNRAHAGIIFALLFIICLSHSLSAEGRILFIRKINKCFAE